MSGQHGATERCWFCLSDTDYEIVKAGGTIRRRFLATSPPSACPRLDEDEQLRPRPSVVVTGPREALSARAARAVRMIRRGRFYGYPSCCIARFAWDILRGANPGPLRGYLDNPWVPCNIWHHAPRRAS